MFAETLLCCLLLADADPHAGWFPFVVPDLASASTAGSPLDLSFLSPEPAGAHGPLRARGEELVDGRGQVVRLFGSNLCDLHVMPPPELVTPIAARLRQLGINFIRLHYYDFTTAPDGLLAADRQSLDPTKLDQMDRLVHQLLQHGIWIDLNLHVARGYVGLPPGWDRMGKGIDQWYEPFIASQERFARELLTHRNPYTGRSYAREPGIAIIELNNENSIFSGQERYHTLPPAVRTPLEQAWATWLRQRYGSREALQAAWRVEPASGPNLLGEGAAALAGWVTQTAGGAATLSRPADTPDRLRWERTAVGSEFWHLQLQRPQLAVTAATPYTFTALLRGTPGQSLELSLMQAAEPWQQVGAAVAVTLQADWQPVQVAWQLADPAGRPVRLNVNCGNTVGWCELREPVLRRGSPDLAPAADLAAGRVPLPADVANRTRAADWLEFLAQLERQTYARLRRLVKDELGALALVYQTQASYGGLLGLQREQQLGDLIDLHGYPRHPRREGAGAAAVWTVRNESLVGAAFGELERLAMWRVAGKPFAVTEFDLNPPNDHAAETFPMLALLAAYQNWAAVADYSWYNFQRQYGHDRISSAFADTGHAGQLAALPAAALLFRQGLVQPARRGVTLPLPESGLAAGQVGQAWRGAPDRWAAAGWSPLGAWQHRLAVAFGPGEPPPPPAAGAAQFRSDSGEIRWDRGAQPTLQVVAPALRLLLGTVGGRQFELGDLQVAVAPGTLRDYAQLSLVALDGLPLDRSRRALLTVLARVENAGMRYRPDRSAVQPDWGAGPTVAEPVQATLRLPGSGWRCQTLRGDGQPAGELPVTGNLLRVGPPAATLWYLLSRD
ncbi:MAG: hypothetical protein IT204_00915 [Fimbriimonadaceae bacterium]|nr:hypothetical protein [Fimbriimonadaceae bacterium]